MRKEKEGIEECRSGENGKNVESEKVQSFARERRGIGKAGDEITDDS
ncbi:uncharacterized protein G2W53_034100 [Senna tora]|uniref:Uncharacterized protein n=1 Tax=Senna tora TaxID=362788 RepID=A0A834WDG9_9FABA|nr:uncharacterized protein G2W53_034100 [Senna tora]